MYLPRAMKPAATSTASSKRKAVAGPSQPRKRTALTAKSQSSSQKTSTIANAAQKAKEPSDISTTVEPTSSNESDHELEDVVSAFPALTSLF